MKCATDNDECIGRVLADDDLPLCQFHARELSEIGEDAFREWYSVELEQSGHALR